MKNRFLRCYYSLSLRTHLILLALLLALPTVLLIIHSAASQRKEAIHKGFGDARRLVSSIALEQYNLTGDAEQLLIALAQIPDIKSHKAEAVNTMLGKILKNSSHFGNIVVADQDGAIWASGLLMTNARSLKNRRSYQNAMSTKKFSSGEYVIGSISGKPTLGFSYPIINERGIIEGVIAANISFVLYNTLLAQNDFTKNISYYFVDRNGVIIHGNSDSDQFVGKKIGELAFKRMQNGPVRDTFIEKDIVGADRIVSYQAMKLPGEQSPYLYVRSSMPTKGALEKARRAELINIAVLTPVLLIALLISIPIADICFVKRIRKLQEASLRLADGDLQTSIAEEVKGGELGELAQAFNNMAQQLAEREKVLYKNQRELDDLYNNAPCGYHSLNKDGLLVRMNDTELKWLGYTRDEIVGKIKFAELIAADSRELYENSFHLFKQQGWSHDSQFELICKNGSVIPLLINSSAINDTDGTFLLSRSMALDISVQKKTELKLHYLNKSLTKRVEIEIEKRLTNERLLARHARLAAVGEMIGAIAHQWRQPLATLGATIQGIRMAWENRCLDNSFMESAESDAQMQIYYMSDTIEGFRNFFRPDKVIELLDVRRLVYEVVPLVTPQFFDSEFKLEVVDNTDGGIFEISGYQNELKQSILNLVSNSLDSILEKKHQSEGTYYVGRVAISIATERELAIIEVQDNGCGIPDEYAEKIFEPYFTTKSSSKGTGIGLYMSRLIIEESMGGRLSFSNDSAGTVFRIELPINISDEKKYE